ncbi:MAG TPA: EamA family transporter [Gaiella sp.]|nr:EamA family transporter [Gaiella sp.]
MTALLAVASALLVGGADFVGGVLSRTASAARVAAVAQVIGLALAVPAALLVESERVTSTDAAWSVASGVAVGLGLVVFYTAMARGLISLVAPVTAVIGAIVPVAYALGTGERPGSAAVTGIALAIVAIALVSLGPASLSTVSAGLGALPLAAAAGCLFGLFYVCFARVHEDAGLWPVAISRTASALVLLGLALAVTGGLAVGWSLVPRIAAIGALEVGAAVTLLLALQRGPVSVAAVLASLYPVTTTFLAAFVLRERLRGLQLVGVALALVAVVLISTA